MYSTQKPKTPSGKSRRGSVKVIESHGRLQLRFRHGSKRHYLSIGLPNTPTNRIVSEQQASQIQLYIISGNFDESLDKYRLEGSKGPNPDQDLDQPTAPSLRVLWEKYCDIKRSAVAPGTWRNGYQVNTAHLKRCPYYSLTDAQKIFD